MKLLRVERSGKSCDGTYGDVSRPGRIFRCGRPAFYETDGADGDGNKRWYCMTCARAFR